MARTTSSKEEVDKATTTTKTEANHSPRPTTPEDHTVTLSKTTSTPSAASESIPIATTTTTIANVEPIIPPKVLYDKSIQTADSTPLTRANWTSTSTSTTTTLALDDSTLQNPSSLSGVGRENIEELRSRLLKELEEERSLLDQQIKDEKRLAEKELFELRKQGLNRDELSTLLGSGPFLDFLDSSTKIVQRALSDRYDYLSDYSVDQVQQGDEGDGARVRLLGDWVDDKVVRGRSITAVDWSPKYPELFAVSYNKNPLGVNEPDGIVCVWNLHLRERPEYVFHAQSDVLSVCFSPFHPNLIIGGTYSGQILLWDTRSKHPYAVLKTPLSATGHTHPVYSLSIVGTQHAHNLISASTDGTVCSWALDLLAKPHEILILTHPSHTKTDEVSITSLSFSPNDASSFLVGTEEGHIYNAQRYDRAGSKAGLIMHHVYKNHSGPITAIEFHPASGTIDLSDLFLSCSVDWTIKLWRFDKTHINSASTSGSVSVSVSGSNTNKNGTNTMNNSNSVKPIFSFEDSNDYIFDIKWHPHHPALFASVDGAGKFDLWNLNIDQEVPLVSTTVCTKGLNKLSWDKEGKRIAVGGADGKIYVYELSQDLITPRENEWELMRKTCAMTTVSTI